jgi:hypothetical protein
MIALINLNKYIGGGETLFVRFMNFLTNKKEDFFVICSSGSYIEKEIKDNKLNVLYKSISANDYYYLNNRQRRKLINEISGDLPKNKQLKFVSFCLRDLYLLIDLSKLHTSSTVTHLILHDQDYLYVCQSLWDKLRYVLLKKRRFSRHAMINFNRRILSSLNDDNSLISMTENLNAQWSKDLQINVPIERTVPLPSCNIGAINIVFSSVNTKKILWIGRIVNFKIPSLLAMIDYLSLNKEYSLTIVGNGDIKRIKQYIIKKNIDQHRITFLGEVPPFSLKEIVEEHSIGYAMGTSVIEIAKYGKPVILALSAPSHLPFKRMICDGIICDAGIGNIGDGLIVKSEDEIETTIDLAIKEIETDYIKYSKDCFEKVRSEFDLNNNLERYLKCIYGSRYQSSDCIVIPAAGFFRKCIYKIFN